MKTYVFPEIQVERLSAEDLLTLSEAGIEFGDEIGFDDLLFQ